MFVCGLGLRYVRIAAVALGLFVHISLTSEI